MDFNLNRVQRLLHFLKDDQDLKDNKNDFDVFLRDEIKFALKAISGGKLYESTNDTIGQM